MTNRVPPLHPASPPPLHPASPPPFSKCTLFDDDIDENDDFGDYAISTTDLEEKFHENSPKKVETTETAAAEILPASYGVDTLCINHVSTFDSNDRSNIPVEIGDTGHEKLTVDSSVTSPEDVIESNAINVTKSSASIHDGISINRNYVHPLISDSVRDNVSSSMCGRENDLNALTSKTADKSIVDEFPNGSSIDQTNETVLSNTPRINDSTVESSGDSSGVTNDAALRVVGINNDVEKEDLSDNSSRESLDDETNDIVENVSSNLDTLFLSKQTYNVSPETPDSSTSAEVPRLDSLNIGFPQVTQSLDGTESFSVQNESVDSFYENDEFDDFVSPSIHETYPIEQLPRDDEISLVDADLWNTSRTTAESSNIINAECWNDIFKYNGGEPVEVNLNTLEGKLNGSSIWCKIKSIEASPALNYNWNDSEIKKILLTTLCVDSRNILFGPRWSSEVPRFASNLGLSPLVPEKASASDNNDLHSYSAVEEPITECNSEKDFQTSVGIRDVLFDWTGSGLTNPLDTRKSDKITKPSSTVCQSDYNAPIVSDSSSVNRRISAEASNILSSLPDLLVMEKQYIVFPIR